MNISEETKVSKSSECVDIEMREMREKMLREMILRKVI